LWENKAICSFWLSSFSNLTDDKALEIITYLNASKQYDENSPTYEQTAKSIAENLFLVTKYKYNKIQKSLLSNGTYAYNIQSLRDAVYCYDMLELCYQIYPDNIYLKKEYEALTKGTFHWIQGQGKNSRNSYQANSIGFNAVSKKDYLLLKLPELNIVPYIPQNQTTNKEKIIISIVIVILILLLLIIGLLSKK
jgi:hypothetical protein